MKKIVFLLSIFPAKTTTFETHHILNAHNAGFEIRIFLQYLAEIKESGQPVIIAHCSFMEIKL